VRGITIIFNNEEIHTGDDLDLVQELKEIGKPKPQTYTVQVPGRNGLLNLTKGLTGRVTYYNRSLSFRYFGTGNRDRLLELDAEFSKYHGQTIRIIDDDHPDHYYEGEASVSTVLNNGYITVTLTVDAQPFRLKRNPTVYSRDIDGAVKLYLDNESIEAVPTITVTADIKISFNDITVILGAGTHTLEKFELRGGVNILDVSGTGTITIEYQEGAI
jgi:hypothetical protein